MKIALIFPNNLSKAPYLRYYLSILEEQNIEYTIYNWDRIGVDESNCVSFRSKEKSRKKWSLFLNFFRFRKFITNRVNNEKYDRVIIFSCQIAILLGSFLIKQFKENYVIDIRDYSSIISTFNFRFKKVLESAKIISISSRGFCDWLPKQLAYTMSHNLNPELLKQNIPKRVYFKNNPLSIDTIGALRDHESNLKVIDQLKNNPIYKMKFIGEGYALPILKEYAHKKNISNIYFHGIYQKEDEFELLKTTDFINIIVGNNFLSRSLTSNRLYLCALLKIPAIVYTNTEQSKLIEKFNFGIVIDSYEAIPKRLLNYKANFNESEFINNCDEFLKVVKQDQKIFYSELLKFLK